MGLVVFSFQSQNQVFLLLRVVIQVYIFSIAGFPLLQLFQIVLGQQVKGYLIRDFPFAPSCKHLDKNRELLRVLCLCCDFFDVSILEFTAPKFSGELVFAVNDESVV